MIRRLRMRLLRWRMHGHIARLESELAIAVNTLAQMEADVHAIHLRSSVAFIARDYEAIGQIMGELDWEARDEEAGLLKADIRVLRVLLAECHEWLETAQRPR